VLVAGYGSTIVSTGASASIPPDAFEPGTWLVQVTLANETGASTVSLGPFALGM